MVADGMPLFEGAQLANDTTLVSTLRGDGEGGQAARGTQHVDAKSERTLKTAHLVARTFFSVLSCPARARLSTLNHACTRGSSLHKSLRTCGVWSGLPPCTPKTPLHP